MHNGSARYTLTQLDREALSLLLHGHTKAASELSTPFVEDTKEQAELKRKSFISRRIKAGEELLRALMLVPEGAPDYRSRTGLVLLRSPTARCLTIVFSGNTSVFSIPMPLVTNADTHIVLIRDPSRCFGFLGIPELGNDYEECLENLERIKSALGVEDTYCVGLSSGGSTAIRVGCDLHVCGVLGFSAPTTLDLSDDPGAELRHYPQLTQLYTRGRQFGIDLARYYAARVPRPGLVLVFSQGHVRDSWLSERMADMEGVCLVPTKGYSGHATYRWLLERGELVPLFDQLFGTQALVLDDRVVGRTSKGAASLPWKTDAYRAPAGSAAHQPPAHAA